MSPAQVTAALAAACAVAALVGIDGAPPPRALGAARAEPVAAIAAVRERVALDVSAAAPARALAEVATLRAARPRAEVAVVLHGPALEAALADARGRALLERLHRSDVRLLAEREALERRRDDPLARGFEPVPSALAALLDLQRRGHTVLVVP